jgi:hypothetical protein
VGLTSHWNAEERERARGPRAVVARAWAQPLPSLSAMAATKERTAEPLTSAERVEDAAIVLDLLEALEDYACLLERGRPPPGDLDDTV